jgi:hypothetical protein
MHQIFRLDELVQSVAHCVDHTAEGSASLLALACCCKSLEGPVMDALWCRQTILSTILRTLPADSWSVDDGVFVRKKLTYPFVSQASPGFQSLSRNLSQEEWNRFRRYTARVTELEVHGAYSQPAIAPKRPLAWVSAETIQLFGMESQRGGFWPRVYSLKCNIGWEAAPFISSFLTPTITNLNLSFPDEDSRFLQPMLSIISHTCHQLQSLTIDGGIFGPLSGGEMGRLISASGSTLLSINFSLFTPPEIFPVIFKLPLLRRLRLVRPRLPDQIPPEILPLLESVAFVGDPGPNLTHFLERLPAKALAGVVVYTIEPIQLAALLKSLSGATTINYLILATVTTLGRPSISLLCTFTNLIILNVQCVCIHRKTGLQCSFQPTDQNLLDLGEALPQPS